MALRRLVSLFVIALVASTGLVGTASADPYGPKTGSALVNKTVVKQGQWVQVYGEGFCPSSPVRVTASSGGDVYIDRTVYSDAQGRVRVHLQLGQLGTTTIELRGCYPGGRTQVLTAQVEVVPHQGKGRASDDKVDKGARVEVWGSGFCKRSDVLVEAFNKNGKPYRDHLVSADKDGRAESTVTLTKAGWNTVVLTGCRADGGTVEKIIKIKVRTSRALSASPSAFAADAADRASSPAGFAVLGGLLVLFAGGHLLRGRRRSSDA